MSTLILNKYTLNLNNIDSKLRFHVFIKIIFRFLLFYYHVSYDTLITLNDYFIYRRLIASTYLEKYRKEVPKLAKETRLDDSADIYAKREKKSEREKMKDMTSKERLEYFKTYYLKIVIGSVLVLGVLVYILYQALSPKPDVLLNIAVVNDYFEQEQVKNFLSDLDSYFEVDSDKEKITFDYNYYISDTDESQNSMTSLQKLTTYVYAKDIDVIITDEAYFKNLTEQGYFISLTELLPTDIYTELVDKYYTGAIVEEDDQGETSTGSEEPYGIHLDDSTVYKNSGSTMTRPVIGVVSNSPNKDNAIKFIKYLLELK
jgi:hypothetical protein